VGVPRERVGQRHAVAAQARRAELLHGAVAVVDLVGKVRRDPVHVAVIGLAGIGIGGVVRVLIGTEAVVTHAAIELVAAGSADADQRVVAAAAGEAGAVAEA